MNGGQRILITGGGGFIGSQLGLHLSRLGVETILLDNLSFGYLDNLCSEGRPFGSFYCRDVNDPNIASLFEGVDVVFHFAGISSLPVCQSDPALAYRSNVSGTANVLEIARRSGVRRVVFSSTSAVYENNKALPFREADPICPNLVYSLTKQAAERVCQSFVSSYSMDVVIVRFFNVYGPHQDVRRVSPPFTSYLARELVCGRRPVIFNQSDVKRDYIYISDVVDALVKMSNSSQLFSGEIFNLCCGVGYSVPHIIDCLGRIAGTKIDPVCKDGTTFWDSYPNLFEGKYGLSRERVKAEVYKESIGDSSKFRSSFSWEPAVSLELGLTNVYRHARELKRSGSIC